MPGNPTSTDIRQLQTRVLQDQLNASAVEGMDFTLASINNELTAPGRLIAQSTPSLVVTVGASPVVNPNTSKNRILPPLSGSVINLVNSTITFPSTSGTITNSNGSNASITIGASQFVAVLVEVNSSSNIVLTVGAAAGSLGAVVVPTTNSSNIQLGYIVAESNGASIIQNITNAMLYQFVQSGSGGGGVTSIAISAPSFLSVSGSPVTTSGTIALTLSGTALPVTSGGTGIVTTTPYAIVAGGTTSTGPLQQVSGTGTTGQVLTSTGASSLPTWQTVNTSGLPNLATFTSSGTWTAPYTGTVMILGVGGGAGGAAGQPFGLGSNGGSTEVLLSGTVLLGWAGGLAAGTQPSGAAAVGNGGFGGAGGGPGGTGSNGGSCPTFSTGIPGVGGSNSGGGGGGASYGSGGNGQSTIGSGQAAAANSGGGGGGDAGNGNNGGGGGGGGNWGWEGLHVVSGNVYTITIGSGGPGGSIANGGSGYLAIAY